MNMQNLPAIAAAKSGEIMEAVIARGDIAKLDANERAKYYVKLCESMGLNPMSRPFEYITLNGKLTLYARKDATDQLRKIYGVSVVDMTETERDGLVIVTVKVKDASGRTDMAKGAVTLKGLSGDNLANAFMKCETKAKRRATLSICGLGFLDETEIETIPNAAKHERLPKKNARDIYTRMQAEVDAVTTREDFDKWVAENEERVKVLPEDWEDILRLRIQERRLDLARGDLAQFEADEGTVVWTDDTPPEWDSAWDALGPVKQAGTLSKDVGFIEFLRQKIDKTIADAGGAAAYIRKRCEVDSRRDLATNDDAAKKWRALVADYRAWQREPAIVDTSHHDATDQPPAGADRPPVVEPAGGEVPLSLEDEARSHARRGAAIFDTFWQNLDQDERNQLKPIGKELRRMMDEAGA